MVPGGKRSLFGQGPMPKFSHAIDINHAGPSLVRCIVELPLHLRSIAALPFQLLLFHAHLEASDAPF